MRSVAYVVFDMACIVFGGLGDVDTNEITLVVCARPICHACWRLKRPRCAKYIVPPLTWSALGELYFVSGKRSL